MFKVKKKAVLSSLLSVTFALGIFASGTNVFAKDIDREVGSYSVGHLNYDSGSKLPSFEKSNSVQPASSTIVYKQDGFVRGSIRAKQNGYDREYFLVHKADVEVARGTKINYKFLQTIKKINETSHSIDTGARVQGGYKFLTEIEGHFDYNYVTSETIEYTKGTETSVSVDEVGDYTIYFYAQAKRYDVYGKWLGYTIDDRTERPLDRYVGEVYEATTYETIRAKKNR
ncbi:MULTISPECIES: hypothetical protein [Brevibacillus]|uniref:hypothetical protein n=1 Tax=Brevibacillus TaxID=55080 RepID=UPI00148F5362|nr:hypothetical protein [Brevibacillus borstelensis]MBE5394793.1 hypothetical protein [Brevibacillus borstelensis]MCC0566126.1 hypothetical protein [Brevibacillus borstelensis]MCM3472896.1 hypothetical protein [Brevibacillus borstelensis]MCM3560840.1 hypothetical protein [Brevibacillus borstelensis]MCM3624359.1 hypothetical protein [Brevibacillus borstelensis]